MKGRFTNGMIKTLSNLLQQDKEKYRVPRRVQDVIPIRRIWPDGIFLVGSKYSKMYRFTDINSSSPAAQIRSPCFSSIPSC